MLQEDVQLFQGAVHPLPRGVVADAKRLPHSPKICLFEKAQQDRIAVVCIQLTMAFVEIGSNQFPLWPGVVVEGISFPWLFFAGLAAALRSHALPPCIMYDDAASRPAHVAWQRPCLTRQFNEHRLGHVLGQMAVAVNHPERGGIAVTQNQPEGSNENQPL